MSPVFGEIDEAACADKKISYVTNNKCYLWYFLNLLFSISYFEAEVGVIDPL